MQSSCTLGEGAGLDPEPQLLCPRSGKGCLWVIVGKGPKLQELPTCFWSSPRCHRRASSYPSLAHLHVLLAVQYWDWMAMSISMIRMECSTGLGPAGGRRAM